MTTSPESAITVETTVNVTLEKVWNYWTSPEHIIKWNAASDDWHTISAINDLKAGGKFNYRVEAKDGSFGFDFEGTYDNVIKYKLITYTMEDGRKVKIDFKTDNGKAIVTETFDPESQNSHELQKTGWQAILDNFRKYAESDF